MFRPRTPFDPLHISIQIIAFQSIFYASQAFTILFFDFFSDIPFTIQQMFNPNIFSFTTGLGRISILSQISASVSAGVVFAFLEQRHRKALDYMSTLYAVHIVLSALCCGIPTKFMWWIITFLGWASATMSAEFISLRIESRAISIQDDADTLFVRDDTKKSSGYQI